MKKIGLTFAAVAASLTLPLAAADHVLEMDHAVSVPEEGFLLGNGDLSVSAYQNEYGLVFRLGKGDVWDRRMDYTGMKRPVTLKEFRDGVLRDGWKVTGWNAKNVDEMKTMKNGERLLEITHGDKPLFVAPYPTPKPVGELKLLLPVDLAGPMKVHQRLVIEEGRAEFVFSWPNGVKVVAEAVVDPDDNVLAVKWDVQNWDNKTEIVPRFPPVSAIVGRWRDPDVQVWAEKQIADMWDFPGHESYFNYRPYEPLPCPEVVCTNGDWTVEQRFFPDPLFPDGFRCRLTPRFDAHRGRFHRRNRHEFRHGAWVSYVGKPGEMKGSVLLHVTTSSDRTLDAPTPRTYGDYRTRAAELGRAYWKKSGLAVPGDRALEDIWYATYHARRCILRPKTVPPGLFFPSSLVDFCRWNGDYHGNYNMQSIYWGDFTANRLDQVETYFDCVDLMTPLARKIAKDYYGTRGLFFQLQGLPIAAQDDYNGSLPLGRMAYPTGWMMTRYWEYYAYTRDRAWLETRGYPLIRDCALFYLDYLLKAPNADLPPELKDGKYHAFPSVQGEGGWDKPLDLCDKRQVMMHVRHCLWAAIEAAKILGVDSDLRVQWQERLDNLAEPNMPKLEGYAKHCFLCAPPEFTPCSRPYAPRKWDGKTVADRGDETRRYFGHTMRWRIGILRDSSFVFERDWPEYRGELTNWRHENGLLWGMAIRQWARCGGWTETLSAMAPLQEMLLQSWDGAIRIFPWWPLDRAAGFRNWRAQGAFLVDAACEGGKVTRFTIRSEKGEDCLVHGDWIVTDSSGRVVAQDKDEFGRNRFKTSVGGTYELRKGERKR